MPGHRCHHCKQWVDEGEAHDCWTTTEAALTQDLSDDLRDAWERLRETAAGFGQQRIYASHKSIMFSRKACYFFVRPKKNSLEVCLFLRRPVSSPRIRRADWASSTKIAHVLDIRHRDEVEPPITDWLREAYDTSIEVTKRPKASKNPVGQKPATRTPARKSAGKPASGPPTRSGRRR